MRYLFRSLYFLPLFFITSAHASQPISESMVECSVIYEIFSNTAEQKGKPQEQIQQMRQASEDFLAASYPQAAKEGQKDSKSYISKTFDEKMKTWETKVYDNSTAELVSDLPEMLDWAKYCGKMGKSYGVLGKD